MRFPLCGYSQGYVIDDGTLALTESPQPSSYRSSTTPVLSRSRAGAKSAFTGGSPVEEAKSLLRPSLPHGRYGLPLTQLPGVLASLVGQKVDLRQDLLELYLKRASISAADLGGPLTTPVPAARYFVIHDTSTPLPASLREFPAYINQLAWKKNRGTDMATFKRAHVCVSRVGTSHTAFDFSQPFSGTKYTDYQSSALKLKFCHIEMIQPRLIIAGSDWKAPAEGFTEAQIERLALVYIAASFRHGEWLVPAYHHNVDLGSQSYHPRHKGPHDDPQNFDLAQWVGKIADLLEKIAHPARPAGGFPIPDSNRHEG